MIEKPLTSEEKAKELLYRVQNKATVLVIASEIKQECLAQMNYQRALFWQEVITEIINKNEAS